MALPLTLLRRIQSGNPEGAWSAIFAHAWEVCSAPLDAGKAKPEVASRDRELANADLFLATAGWDLWASYEGSVPRTSDSLATWWKDQPGGRAVLILDALSLREVPWLLQGAKDHGYTMHRAQVTGAELPADTTPFAKALGFAQRSALENDGAGANHRLAGARTAVLDLPWEECIAHLTPDPRWVLWHKWPDHRLHDLGEPGKGLASLVAEAAERLTSDGFWLLVERLTTGRRLVITSDHGYAASGDFPDTSDAAQTQHLKDRFKARRWTADEGPPGPFIPPIDLAMATQHGCYCFVLGRRKWRTQGGYPTLTHGGLSVLEVAVPFIELSR